MPVIPGSKHKGSARRKPIPVVDNAPRIVHQLFSIINSRHINMTELSRRAGPRRETIYGWAKGRTVRLFDLEAVLSVLNAELNIKEKDNA